MNKEFAPTYPELLALGLTETQIDLVVKYENEKHGFRNYLKNMYHAKTPPHSLFFLDIKDTLYHSFGHSGYGCLGRAKDALPLSFYDNTALVTLLNQGKGSMDLSSYKFSDEDRISLSYDFPKDRLTAKYKLDLPKENITTPVSGVPLTTLKFEYNPYKIIFISSDPVDVQKRIITFLLIISMYDNIRCSFSSVDIDQLSRLYETSNYDFYKFSDILTNKYKEPPLNHFDKEKIDTIINQTVFLSTDGTNKTKLDLMEEYIGKYNKENNLITDDYNVFACGDDYEVDGPMIKYALQLGGYGCLNTNNIKFRSNHGEEIRRDLCKESNLEIKRPLISYGFNDFYNKAMDYLSIQRTWDIAETMSDINNPSIQKVKNRFYKTNHYIKINKN